MTRLSPDELAIVSTELYHIWERRVDQSLNFFVLFQKLESTVLGQSVVGLFEDYTFEDVAKTLTSKYPEASLPRGWKEDLENKNNTGFIPSDILSIIKKSKLGPNDIIAISQQNTSRISP